MENGRAPNRRRQWYRGKASAWHRAGAVAGVVGVAAGIALAVVYNWPRSTELVTYFTLRPAWCWFAMTAPLVMAGAFGLRWKPWLVCTVAWLGAFVASEELAPLLRLAPGEAEARFQSLRATTSSEGPFAFRMITWNISADPETTGHAFEQIAAYDPDIVLLQECGTGSIVPDALAGSQHFRAYALLRSMDNAVSRAYPNNHRGGDAARCEQCAKRGGRRVRYTPTTSDKAMRSISLASLRVAAATGRLLCRSSSTYS